MIKDNRITELLQITYECIADAKMTLEVTERNLDKAIEEVSKEATHSLDSIIAISDDIKNDTEWVNDSKTKAEHEGVCSGLNMLINHLKEIEESEVSNG